MARHDFDLTNPQRTPEVLEDPNERVIHLANQKLLRLKQADVDGNWSPNGTYTTSSLLLEVWKPDAKSMKGLLGFCIFEEEVNAANGDAILFRLGNQDGAQPLYYDKVTDPLNPAWRVPATDAEWNTDSEIDEGIETFPFDGSVATFIKLVSGNGKSTPVFRGFYIFWEVRYDPTEDVIRSIHRKLTEEVFINADTCILVEPGDPTDKIDFDTPDMSPDDGAPIWRPEEPIAVFNEADDPACQNNLFQSFADGCIQLTSAQEGQLLIQYRGRLDRAHVVSDADFEREELPAVIINNVSQPRTRDYLLSDDDWPEPLRSKGIVRLRTNPARHAYNFQIQAPAQYALHDKKLADAVRRAFDTKEFVRSIALDEDFTLVGLETVNQINRVGDQVFTRIVLVSVSVLEWMPGFRDVPMLTDLIVNQRLLPKLPGGRSPEAEPFDVE